MKVLLRFDVQKAKLSLRENFIKLKVPLHTQMSFIT